jgi:hypothetical protein
MSNKDDRPVLELVETAKRPPRKITPNKNNGGNGGAGGGGGADKAQRFGEYIIKNNAFHQVKTVKAGLDGSGVVEIPLCDFVAKITEEIVCDDGLSDTSFLRIEGRRNDGRMLPLADVPAKEFYSQQGNWVNSSGVSR